MSLEAYRKMWLPRGGPEYSQRVKALFDFELIEELCVAYLDADEGDREAMRVLATGDGNILEQLDGYVGFARRQLMTTRDPRWLRLGLAAASAGNLGIDARDTVIELEGLFLDAVDVGLDPGGDFDAVGALSSATATPIGSPRSHLEGFAAYVEREPPVPKDHRVCEEPEDALGVLREGVRA